MKAKTASQRIGELVDLFDPNDARVWFIYEMGEPVLAKSTWFENVEIIPEEIFLDQATKDRNAEITLGSYFPRDTMIVDPENGPIKIEIHFHLCGEKDIFEKYYTKIVMENCKLIYGEMPGIEAWGDYKPMKIRARYHGKLLPIQKPPED